MAKYVVTLKRSYNTLTFCFDSGAAAINFMHKALLTNTPSDKDDAERPLKASMEIIKTKEMLEVNDDEETV